MEIEHLTRLISSFALLYVLVSVLLIIGIFILDYFIKYSLRRKNDST